MIRTVAVALLALVVACTGRQVEVGTGPETGVALEAPMLRVTNALAQPVNVYVVLDGRETYVTQVAAQSTQQAAVQGVAANTTVLLRAREADGRRTYERANVTLGSGVFEWRVP